VEGSHEDAKFHAIGACHSYILRLCFRAVFQGVFQNVF